MTDPNLAPAAAKQRKLTGWHVLAIFGGAFGVIIAVNVTLAVSAVRTFPGLEVKNSYVASQEFDRRRASQEALGWTVRAEAQGGEVSLAITDADGTPVQVGKLNALVGRPTEAKNDHYPDFRFDGRRYVAADVLDGGHWIVRMEAVALDGTEFTQRLKLHVKD